MTRFVLKHFCMTYNHYVHAGLHKAYLNCLSQAQKLGHLHGVTFARTEFKAGLDFVIRRTHSGLIYDGCGENSPQMTLNISGVGSPEFSSIICQKLNVRSAEALINFSSFKFQMLLNLLEFL